MCRKHPVKVMLQRSPNSTGSERGTALVETVLVVALTAIVTIAGVSAVGDTVQSNIHNSAFQVANGAGGASLQENGPVS